MVFRCLKTTRCCFDGPPIPILYYTTKICIAPNRQANQKCCGRVIASLHAWGVSMPQNHALLLRQAPNTSTCMGFSQHNKIPCCRVAVHMLWEKGIRFWHPDYHVDRAQKLISSSMSQHLSTRNISSKYMHAFLSNLAHRQTDKQTRECEQKHIPPPLS